MLSCISNPMTQCSFLRLSWAVFWFASWFVQCLSLFSLSLSLVDSSGTSLLLLQFAQLNVFSCLGSHLALISLSLFLSFCMFLFLLWLSRVFKWLLTACTYAWMNSGRSRLCVFGTWTLFLLGLSCSCSFSLNLIHDQHNTFSLLFVHSGVCVNEKFWFCFNRGVGNLWLRTIQASCAWFHVRKYTRLEPIAMSIQLVRLSFRH